MGLGAGTFKPIISGTIARVTDESNSTLGFGIFYWSINLGAFLVPLLLVPYLKNNIGWEWVLIAAAIGTGSMLLPTLLLYREPPQSAEAAAKPRTDLVQTLANAFEIVYSPVVLVAHACRGRAGVQLLVAVARDRLRGARRLAVRRAAAGRARRPRGGDGGRRSPARGAGAAQHGGRRAVRGHPPGRGRGGRPPAGASARGAGAGVAGGGSGSRRRGRHRGR